MITQNGPSRVFYFWKNKYRNRVSTGAGKAGKRADFGKWAGKAGKTYTFRCPEAGKAGKKYTLDIKLA